MKLIRWINLVLALLLLAACKPLSTPQVGVTHAPSAEAAMRTYLDALNKGDYASMYGLLTQANRDALVQDDFSKRYNDVLNAMAVSGMEYSILSTTTNPQDAKVDFHIVYHSALFGDLQRDITANLSLENGEWRVQWDDGLILPELSGGNHLATDYDTPQRGDIYDRNGDPIVTQTDAYAIGLVPGEIDPEQEDSLLGAIRQVTGLRPDTIRAMYDGAQPDWYIPVAEISAEQEKNSGISGYSGVILTSYTSRYYLDGGIAPQAVGYSLSISAEDLDAYRRRGYSGAEKIGAQGIEKWGEPYLAGNNGATLYVVDAAGNVGASLASVNSQPAQSITLTIDRDLQEQAQQAMDGMAGAAVVIERDTGRILAMVSSPGFDPNLFDINNYNIRGLDNLLNDSAAPLTNRAAQEVYPLGSVFKIITMAAALESGVYTPDSTYDCQYDFTELGPDHILHDWTYDHCQNELATTGECTTKPSGILTLPQGLMRSCNPWFMHIGYDLYMNQGKGNAISDMARAFGLGRATGIDQISEAEGQIPNPGDGVQATSIAIGQSDVRVTPLQVALFTAAVGNGGTLYRPQIVEKIQPVDGNPTLTFTPEVVGTLPVKPENLKVIQDAMLEVVKNQHGTAWLRLNSLDIPVAGKTGTAESGIPGYPHAWFTGYSMANRSDKPDIAVAVLVEYKGEGSNYAAPIFRRIMEIYFHGRPQTNYWFESSVGVTETPTPEGGEATETAAPQP